MKTKKMISIREVSAILAMTVVLSAGSALAALTLPKINGAAAGTGTACQVTNPPTISVASSTYTDVWVKFTTQNGATWRLPMTNGGAQYAIVMPVMPAGTISYRIEAGETFDALSDTNAVEFLPTSTTYYTYVNSETLGINRQPNLAAWRPVVGIGPTPYTGNPDAYWRGVALTMNNADNTVNLAGIMPATAGPPADPSVRTLSSLTVGTIWFKARFEGNEGMGILIVEKSSNSGHTSTHTLIETLAVPYSSNWFQYKIDINSDSPAWYRIRHPSGIESDNIRIKDIVISKPTADVALFKDEVDYSPGYPGRDDPVTFKISVTNVIAGAPAANISPKLVWRLNEGSWTQTSMPWVAGNQYEVTLPKMNPGKFEYYYRSDFTGYAYTGLFYPTGGNPADNESDFAIWLDPSKKIAETKGPAYYPDFENSHLYNLGLEPPKAINGGSTAPDPFSYLSFNIRRFRSMHDTLTLALVPTDGTNLNVEPSYNMEQVGDYTWQSVLHITNTIDIGASVIGTYRYTNSATIFAQSPVEWLDDNQDPSARNPPMSGNAVDVSGTDPIQIQMTYNGFIMFRFCSTNGYYEVRRAAWQDFNAWQANNTEFSRSFGLYQTDTYESDLVGKSPTVMDSASIPSFEVGTTVSPSILDETYFNGLRVDKAWLIQERSNLLIEAVSYRNRAIKVSASPSSYGKGSIQTTSGSATDGRDTLTMRVRASMDDDNFAVYKRGALFENYKVTAEAKTLSMSDATNASVSVYGYYQDKNNYIEARLTQERSTYNYLSLKLLQAKNGVVTILRSVNYGSNTLLTTAPEWFLMLTLTTVPLSPSSGTATFELGNSAATPIAATTGAVGFSIDYPNTYIGGTIAVNSRDAQAEIQVSMTTDGGASLPEFSSIASSPQAAWDMGGLMEVSGAPRWIWAGGPTMLRREIPVVKYRVSVFRNGLNTSDIIAPVPSLDSAWDTAWDLNGNGDEEKSVNTFAYQNVSFPMHLWDNVFIKVAPTGSDGFLVVDDLAVKAWRGDTLYDPTLSGSDPDEELVWKATYAVINDYDRGNLGYELARSRANPDEDQMIVSPLLLNGIGDILFNYLVTTGNVSFSVESLLQNGQVHETLFTTNIFASVSNSVNRIYVPALTNFTGRLRIRINNAQSSPDGVIFIDNLKATNYPNVGDTSWEAYNLLISTFDFSPDIKFDGAANTAYRSTALNNSYTANTPLGVAYDADKPYLQSPKIETGIGEVSFWYRAYPTPLTGYPGKIYMKAAKNVGDDEELWITLGKNDLNADSPLYAQQVESLDGLTNITSSAWTYFSVEFFKADYKIFRIYSDVGLNDRVMLDNVIVTEPVRTSIDIASVELIPAVPLYTDKVGVRVALTNPRMNPTDIKVYLLYTIGTDTWGRDNWATTNEVALTQDPNNMYLFTVTNAILKKPIDTVVQYAVKVEYTGTFSSPIYYGEEFVNPSWYEPIDLNEQFAPASKTPYYFVFSVGTNCVFINEFLPFGSGFFTGYVGLSEQYVELIGIENGNIENWRLETIRPAASQQKDVAIWTNVLMSAIDSKTQFTSRFVSGSSEPTDKGWGFYTLACAGVSVTNSHFKPNNPIIVDQELYPASVYTLGYQAPVNVNNIIGLAEPGALSLKRSMGAYVQRIAWGAPSSIQALLDRGYEQLPVRGVSSTLYRKVYSWAGDGNPEGESLAWVVQLPALYSPGYYNTSQAELIWTLDPVPEEEPNVDPPAITVAIKSIQLDLTKATLQFAVASTNGFALTIESGFTWAVETSEEVSFSAPTSYPISGDITALDTGAESTYSVDVNLDEPVLPTLFYRVKATHP